MPAVCVIPEIVDVERLNIALSETFSNLPLLAGRIIRPDTPDAIWKVRLLFSLPLTRRVNHGLQVRLTNSGVPVSFVDSDADEIFPTDFVIQPMDRFAKLLDGARIASTEGDPTRPLARVRITRFTKLNSTSIGIRFSHVLRAFSLDLPNLSCGVDGNYSSRWIQPHAVLRNTLSAIPRPRTNRSPTLLRTGSDQIHRITGGSPPNV